MSSTTPPGSERKRKRESGTLVEGDVTPVPVPPSVLGDFEYLESLGINIHRSWAATVASHFKSAEGRKLLAFVEGARKSGPVFPADKDVFTALRMTPLDAVRVCIIGQDPYHG
jgi:hypothetical protein